MLQQYVRGRGFAITGLSESRLISHRAPFAFWLSLPLGKVTFHPMRGTFGKVC